MTVKAPAGSRKRAQNNLESGARKQNIQCAKSIFFLAIWLLSTVFFVDMFALSWDWTIFVQVWVCISWGRFSMMKLVMGISQHTICHSYHQIVKILLVRNCLICWIFSRLHSWGMHVQRHLYFTVVVFAAFSLLSKTTQIARILAKILEELLYFFSHVVAVCTPRQITHLCLHLLHMFQSLKDSL